MATVTIYHNPSCTKSRQTLALLKERGIEPKVIEYIKDPLTKKDLTTILELLNMKAQELIRNEGIYKEQKTQGKTFTEIELINLMIEHPRLIQRPIVVKGTKAVLGRPPENVLTIL